MRLICFLILAKSTSKLTKKISTTTASTIVACGSRASADYTPFAGWDSDDELEDGEEYE
jgi:hypothetical protein